MKQKLITDYFNNNYKNKKNKLDNYSDSEEIVYGYNSKTDSWHCTLCGIDMGKNNPRQYCRKTYCENFQFTCLNYINKKINK